MPSIACKTRADLLPAQHYGEMLRPARADQIIEPRQTDIQDVAVQEQQRGERLVLGRGGDLPVDGEPGQEAAHLAGAHLPGVPLVMEQDEATNPVDVGVLGAGAVMPRSEGRSYAVEQARRTRSIRRPRLAHTRDC